MTTRRLRISVLGAAFNTQNMGVGALAAGTLASICHQYPDAEISFVDYGKQSLTIEFPLQDRLIPVKFVNIRFSKKFYLPNNIALLILLSLGLRLVPTRWLRYKLGALNPWLQHMYESDLVVAMSGGDSFSDIYGMGRFLYAALPQLLAIFSGKRLILLPQTLGPFRGKLTRAIAKYIMSRADTTCSRDYKGLSDIEILTGAADHQGRRRFCYDVGFVVAPRRPAKLEDSLHAMSEKSSPVVGLNVSGLLSMGGYTHKNMFGLKVDYNKLMKRLIEFFIHSRGATVLLVPHVFGGVEDNSESDSVACETVYRSLQPVYGNKILLVSGRYDQNEIKYIIGMCDFFVGSRMHACIAALSQSIPALAIAYSDKFIGVLQTLGVDSLVADARSMNEDSIVNAAAHSYAHRSGIRQRLEDKIPPVKEMVLNLFADVDGLNRTTGSFSSIARTPVR
jgi:colanic acid/amylovoran biosynthesis protein